MIDELDNILNTIDLEEEKLDVEENEGKLIFGEGDDNLHLICVNAVYFFLGTLLLHDIFFL